MAGLSLPEVQRLLRHRNASTTEKYIHLADRARLQDRAMAGMAPLREDAQSRTVVVPLARGETGDGR